MSIRITWLSLAFVASLAAATGEAAPKRDRTVDLSYPTARQGAQLALWHVEAQVQKKTAFVWLSRGDAKRFARSKARLQFSSRNWKNVRVRLRPEDASYVTVKHAKLLGGPLDFTHPLTELKRTKKTGSLVVPPSRELEGFTEMDRTLRAHRSRPRLVVRVRDRLSPAGDTHIVVHARRYTIDATELAPFVAGKIAAMAILNGTILKEKTKLLKPTLLTLYATSRPSESPLRSAWVYLIGRSVTQPMSDSFTTVRNVRGAEKRPLYLAALLRDLGDSQRDRRGADYDAIHVPDLPKRMVAVYRAANPSYATANLGPFGGSIALPIPGTANPIKNWLDLVQRLAPEASKEEAAAVLYLNGIWPGSQVAW